MRDLRALIVDDSSVMRKIIERSLRAAGLSFSDVFEASSSVEALEVLRGESVDPIFSDIQMPQMDGLEFLRQMKAANLAPGVPVVIIATESSGDHVMRAVEAGAQGFIRKPFTPDQVKDRVMPLLEGIA